MNGKAPTKSLRISVRGVVQGVGFRPFVYRLAHEYGLSGWVRNTSGSVEIEVEGQEAAVDRFITALKAEAPPMASIEEITTAPMPPKGHTDFVIVSSRAERGKYQLVSPDIATCRPCQEEIFSPGDRRYRYPFTNCTNCGPRFTIIKDIPYDRPRTTMGHFKMCSDCQREYDDPLDRRFHAQPNACPKCGPRLELADGLGNAVASSDVIHSAADLLKEGKILAIKGLGGFLLACDATNRQTVHTLRERKRRLSKPFAVMMASLDDVRKHCLVSSDEESLLLSPQCPIVLLRWQEAQSDVCSEVAPGLKYLGVMLPYTPLHHLLMRETNLPLIMTSGNLSEEPIAKDNDEALRRLGHIAEYFLLHDRGIYAKYDDSVYTVEQGTPRAVRRARGYAPYPIFLPFKARPVLACGAEEKNTFCLTKDEHAFVSQHIGDLENEETLQHFEDTVELYERLFRIEPEIVAYDLHPEYLSSKYALGLRAEGKPGLRPVPVQHHHAHVVSCMVENNVKAPVIGVAFDGTGYGTDGTLWGGEFLVADWKGFERVGHLEPVPMPGGAAAIHRPYRMALGYLYGLTGQDILLEGLPILGRIDSEEVAIIKHQVERRLNSPLTSGAGRLFDAVSALAGVRGVVDYEAQAAIELEMLATDVIDPADSSCYPFSIVEETECRVLKLADLISAVVEDVEKGVPAPLISARFHRTMARIIVRMCRLIAGDRGIRLVALSGGVFQNRLLSRLTLEALQKEGFEVLTHRLVPCNDGGISLGQAVIANFALS
ncbi:MAG: carbamoyltransferase HypF [Chloroflexi bacterium RBG_13_53_26]|nr:MAG: carbamoyltransferase HypF [Chloroflexi bacterium RBG_13_53_26]